MTDRISVAKSSPYVTFVLAADVLGYNPGGGFATVRCYLRASKGSGSYFNGSGAQIALIDGVGEAGRYSATPFLPSGSTGWSTGPYDINVPMSAQRTVTLRMALRYGNVSTDHTAGLSIPWTPQAPTPVGVDQLTPTSARYRFSGNGNNGSAISGWQAQIATDPAFTQNVQTWGSTGTTTFTGLTPATLYYFRSRGSNGVGWGPWSSVVSAMTASGAYVSQNGSWVPVPVYVGNGSAWTVPAMQVSNGMTWEAAQ